MEEKMLRKGLKVVVVVVCLGYLMMWIMLPTMTYRTKWSPSTKAKLGSTYFGTQGPNLLLYTFPVLFVAVLGSVYLHLGKQASNSSMSQRSGGDEERKVDHKGLGMVKRPVLVKGPLGIVTGIELGFLMLFIALLVWLFANYLHIGFSGITPAELADDGVAMWQAKLEEVGLRLGLTGNLCLVLLFFPVTRGSSILPIFGLTSEMSIKYHIWLGHITMTLFTAHGFCYLLLWASTDTMSDNMLEWAKTGISNVAGELALLAGLVLWVMTFPRIRRKAFEAFFYAHYLYILFVFFFFLHVGISYAGYMLPGFYLFMIDRYLRFLQSRQRVRLLSSRVLASGAFELNFSKSPSLIYNPTSIMFINVPSISNLQWHPYTITSNSSLEPEKLSVVIKVEGSWTRKLYDMLASSTVDRIEVSVEGPYGPASTDFLRHEKLVLVSGGSGITPFFSIIRELIHASTTLKCKIPKIHLICAFKKLSDIALLDLLLPMTGTPSDLSSVDITIDAYITRHKEATRVEDAKQEVRTQWFKSNAKDTPISPILGKNGWLWLGLIIASSFIGFLVIMGILTRYYIYPIDHNTNKIFSSSTRVVLNVLIMCICIAISAGVAVVWNKRKSAMEATHITSLEASSPTISPQSLFYNADRELESLPHQSLAQSTNVHYGEKPDLKRMLFDCKGTSVGVLVSGPKKLRHHVAAICGSGLADHVHFESISFSW